MQILILLYLQVLKVVLLMLLQPSDQTGCRGPGQVRTGVNASCCRRRGFAGAEKESWPRKCTKEGVGREGRQDLLPPAGENHSLEHL